MSKTITINVNLSGLKKFLKKFLQPLAISLFLSILQGSVFPCIIPYDYRRFGWGFQFGATWSSDPLQCLVGSLVIFLAVFSIAYSTYPKKLFRHVIGSIKRDIEYHIISKTTLLICCLGIIALGLLAMGFLGNPRFD